MVEVRINNDTYSISKNTLLVKKFITNFPLPLEVKEFKDTKNEFKLKAEANIEHKNRSYNINIETKNPKIIEFLMKEVDFYTLLWPEVLQFNNSPWKSYFKEDYNIHYGIHFTVEDNRFWYSVTAYKGKPGGLGNTLVGVKVNGTIEENNIKDLTIEADTRLYIAEQLYGKKKAKKKILPLLDEFRFLGGIPQLSKTTRWLIEITKKAITKGAITSNIIISHSIDNKKTYITLDLMGKNIIIKGLELNHQTVKLIQECITNPEKCMKIH